MPGKQSKKDKPVQFEHAIVGVSKLLLESWKAEVIEWFCSRQEAHHIFGEAAGTDALVRLVSRDQDSEIYNT